jgi:hypothetical protein
MDKSYYFRKYGYDCFDKHGCLRPSKGLVVSISFLCRALLLPVLIGVASVKGSSQSMTWVLAGNLHPALMSLLALPALAVLAALVGRSPRARPWLRWVWAHGRNLLLLSAVAQAGIVLRDVTTVGLSLDSAEAFLSVSVLVLLAGLIAYLLWSRRVRDSFSEFPSPESPPGTRTRTNGHA